MFKRTIMKAGGFALIAVGFAGACLAIPAVPEINPATGANAVALVAGVLMILRSRRK